MEKIDKLDRQILEIISQNARIPFRDVADQCGVSRAAIHQRVQRMIENNVISHAICSGISLGKHGDSFDTELLKLFDSLPRHLLGDVSEMKAPNHAPVHRDIRHSVRAERL